MEVYGYRVRDLGRMFYVRLSRDVFSVLGCGDRCWVHFSHTGNSEDYMVHDSSNRPWLSPNTIILSFVTYAFLWLLLNRKTVGISSARAEPFRGSLLVFAGFRYSLLRTQRQKGGLADCDMLLYSAFLPMAGFLRYCLQIEGNPCAYRRIGPNPHSFSNNNPDNP